MAELRFWRYDRAAASWSLERTFKGEGYASPSASAVSAEESDAIWLTSSSYTEPTTLAIAEAAAPADQERLKSLPAFYEAEGLQTQQLFATSADGTRVPYFIISREDAPLDGSTPALLYGYGGFEISLTPGYAATVGAAWLEKGYAYVQVHLPCRVCAAGMQRACSGVRAACMQRACSGHAAGMQRVCSGCAAGVQQVAACTPCHVHAVYPLCRPTSAAVASTARAGTRPRSRRIATRRSIGPQPLMSRVATSGWHAWTTHVPRMCQAYEDFEAVAKDLVARGITSHSKLGCQGGSNGGLLTGNMLARSPELFGAIVCQVRHTVRHTVCYAVC